MTRLDQAHAPYLAATILGSLIHPDIDESHVERMIDEGLLPVTLILLKGCISFSEQRAAVRIVNHASYKPATAQRILQHHCGPAIVWLCALLGATYANSIVSHAVVRPSRTFRLVRAQMRFQVREAEASDFVGPRPCALDHPSSP